MPNEHIGLAERILRDINIGTFGPDEWLKQVSLAERYSATRIATRQALDELVAKRVIQHRPNYGYRVYSLSETQRKEIAAVRSLLEAATADDIVANATPEDIAALQASAEEFKAAAYDGTIMAQRTANQAFHRRLLLLCGNQTLTELIQDLRQRGPAAPVTRWRTVAQLEKSTVDHFKMVEAIKSRSSGELRRIIVDHVNNAE